MTDIEKLSDQEIVNEYEICQQLWSKYSSDCLGFYISALQKEISKRAIIHMKPLLKEFKHSKNVVKDIVSINNTVDFFDVP